MSTTSSSSSAPYNDEDGCSSPLPQTSSLSHTACAQFNGSSDDNLLYSYEDPFLLPSHDTSPTSLSSSTSLTSPNTQHQHASLLTRYKSFLQRHSSLLSLLEMLMERFVFYGHLFKSHHHADTTEEEAERGIVRTEMYYAVWNVIRWINDVVLVGVGGGIGFTVGTRGEWLALSDCSNNKNNSNQNDLTMNHQWINSKLDKLIPIIRATLTATTCIYPAVEAFSRRPIHNNRGENNHWDRRRYKAALVSYRLERVRFMGRMCLLVISWWAKLQRRRHQQQLQQQSHEENTLTLLFVPSLLQRGGELDPYEELVSLTDAEDEARVVQYKGRRTGRRSISNTGSTIGVPSSSCTTSPGLTNIPIIGKATNLIEWISKLLKSTSVNRLVYVYAVGEILHILRPMYWSSAQCTEWQRRSSIPQQLQRGKVSNSWSIWKAWWVSLFMDLISDKLLRLSNARDDDLRNRQSGRRRSSFIGRRGGKHSTQQHHYHQSTSAEEAKLDELEWRRSRHGLYLLRSPMYDVVTRPVASFVARVVSMIPSLGLGRWAAEYVLDMMSYWNENHFMLES